MREINAQQEVVWQYNLDSQLDFELSGSSFKAVLYEKEDPRIINAQESLLDPSEY